MLVLAGPHGIYVAATESCGSTPPLSSQTTTFGSCGPTKSVERTGVGLNGGGTASRIVPNGNRTVAITTDRGRVTAALVANVYYATGCTAFRALHFTTTDGRVRDQERG